MAKFPETKRRGSSALVGRAAERRQFEAALDSDRGELIALYGRRRIGKTFLIRSCLRPAAGTYLEVTGTRNGNATLQRRHFREALQEAFADGQLLPDFASWEDALSYLTKRVQERVAARPREHVVLFFDELPWLATPKARLLEALEYQWNRYLSELSQVTMVLCGSAASWMLRRIVQAKGGLHNRLTRRIRLEPFTLREADAMLRSRKIRLQPMELMTLYMAIGGVPYYLSLVDRGRSVAETIGELCFERGGALHNEFEVLFASLFEAHEDHLAMLRALAAKNQGLSRNELLEALGRRSGSGPNRRLEELEEAGFIGRFDPFLGKKKNTLFRLLDPYTLFYLRWIERASRGAFARGGASHWQSRANTASYRAWCGFAFEGLCLQHATELQRALGIEGLTTRVGSWRYIPRGRSPSPSRRGAQVDLLIERRDDVVHLCELKFSTTPFVVSRAYARELAEKVELFERHSRLGKRIMVTLICAQGMQRNMWSDDIVDCAVDARTLIDG